MTFVPSSAALAFAADSDQLATQYPTFERPRVITLCGSTKFMDEFTRANQDLTLKGNVVFSVATTAYEGSGNVSAAQKSLLDSIHLEKIRLSDAIFVLNVGGYIGPSTAREIEYARRIGRAVCYLEPPKEGASLPR